MPRCKEGVEAIQFWNNLDCEVCPGLKDKFGEVADSVLPKSGLEIFCWWYGQANTKAPSCNVWKYDMGKLVCPIIFRDMDLLEELLEGYDPITHQVLDTDGRVLFKIGIEEVKEAFSLIPIEEISHEIDFNAFNGVFDKIAAEPKKRMFLTFVKEVNGVKLPYEAIQGNTHLMEHYNDTLVNTHTTLHQVLGLKNENKFGTISMWLCWGFQRVGSPMILNFLAYLNTNINEGLAKLKKKERVSFRFYSMLMHLLLF